MLIFPREGGNAPQLRYSAAFTHVEGGVECGLTRSSQIPVAMVSGRQHDYHMAVCLRGAGVHDFCASEVVCSLSLLLLSVSLADTQSVDLYTNSSYRTLDSTTSSSS